MQRIRHASAASITVSLLVVGTILSPAHGGETSAPDSPAQMMTRIEERQSPNRQGLDPLTLHELMRKYHVPGVSVTVIKDFKIHWAKGCGVADVETGRPVEPNTLFQAASISKPVTAMALLKLVQDGRIPLDADINRSLKSWKIPASDFAKATPVTARALLSHTSGAGDGFGFPGYKPSEPRPTLLQILKGEQPSNVGPVLFERAPFTAYKYSGGGFAILQLAMTDVVDQPFAEIMRKELLDPLGMTQSSFEQPLSSAREPQTARAHGAGRHFHGCEGACLSRAGCRRTLDHAKRSGALYCRDPSRAARAARPRAVTRTRTGKW